MTVMSDAVLDMARRDERIFVGARANPVEEINAVCLACSGKRVVRLKGGDPCPGRVARSHRLAEAGIAHEVVPGVTAALACAAQAGIPLTHRDAARSVTLVTGHTRDGRLDVDFVGLARPGQTLAVYMGVSTLRELEAGLVAAGLDASTPAAVIENGGSAGMRVLTGTLASVAHDAAGWARGGPALILVGEVISHAAVTSLTRMPAALAPLG